MRFTYYTGNSSGFHCRPRSRVMCQLFNRENIGLVTSRMTKGEEFAHVQATRHITEVICMSPKTSNNGFVFPLWIYPSDDSDLISGGGKRANLTPEFVDALTQALGKEPSPEDILAWIYAVLHAPSYRARYANFLKRDFAHIPLTTNTDLFDGLVALGHELIALHTMEQPLPRITTFDVPGNNEVEKVRWTKAKNGIGRVYINAEQYFGKVPEGVWETLVGGYRVAEKWLKDRRGRQLSYDDLEHYQSVIAALARTLEIQAETDAAIEEAGGWPLR